MKKYRVKGGTRFKGHAPGEVFDAEFTDKEEKRYIERGAIELADGAAAVEADSAPSGEGESGDGDSSTDTGRGAGSGLLGGGRKGKE